MELQPGERVIFTGHPSWRSILDFYFKGLGIVILGAAIAALVTLISDKVDWAISGGVAGALMVLVVLVGLIRRISTTYTITDRRLHIRKGVFTRVTRDTRLERVQNVNTRQSIVERLLRVGTVDFDTAGTEDSDFAFVGVSSPRKVVEAVDTAQHQRELEREPDEPSAGTAPPPPAPPSTDL
jgi:membrane protein YdbS with pleckstrin-like domain